MPMPKRNSNTSYRSCGFDLYELPVINFVGGCFLPCNFHIYHPVTGKPVDLEGYTATFSVVNFENKHGKPLIKKEMTVRYGTRPEEKEIQNILYVDLLTHETINLEGKFLYQITVRDDRGHSFIPKQGVMFIINNIDRE